MLRWRGALLATIVVTGAVVASLVAVELAFRLFLPEPVLPRYVVDSGHGIRTNARNVATEHYYPKQYRVPIRTNSAGMRGSKEYSVAKAPGTFRIAVLGDSFAFGYGVTDEEVVNAQLEQILNRNAAIAVDVLNFAVSGFGTAEELIAYEQTVRSYDPDIVIVFYFNNDLGNNVASELFELTEEGELRRTGKTYLPGIAIRQTLYAIAPTRWLFEHSHAWNFVRNRLSGIVLRSFLKKHDMRSTRDANPAADRLNRALVLELTSRVAQDGVMPIFFIVPERNLTTNFPASSEEIAERGGVLLDGRRFLTAADYYNIDGHWRASGHAKAAEAVADHLSRAAVTAGGTAIPGASPY